MTVEEAYKKAVARKKEAVKEKTEAQKNTFEAEKKQVSDQTQTALLDAYAKNLRLSAEKGQTMRASGVSGGAAKAERERDAKNYQNERSVKKAQEAQKRAAIDASLKEAEQTEAEKLAQLDNELYERQASSTKNAQSRALSMMRLGIYDASFASVLGVSDREIRDFIKRKRS